MFSEKNIKFLEFLSIHTLRFLQMFSIKISKVKNGIIHFFNLSRLECLSKSSGIPIYAKDSIFKYGIRLSLFTIIFFNLLPGGFIQTTVIIDHFFSSMHMFEYAYAHGFVFGKDIIDNVGPYGFLHYPYVFTGGAYWAKFFWFGMLSAIYSFYTVLLMKDLKTLPEKCLFIFTMIFFPMHIKFPWYAFEVLPRLAILFPAIYLLTLEDETNSVRYNIVHVIFSGIFYGLMLLEKASNVYYLGFIIAVLSLYWLTKRQYKYIVCLSMSFLIATLSFWLVAGQKLTDLPTYFQSMRAFIDSYENALSMDMNTRLLRHAWFCNLFIAWHLLFRTVIFIFVFRSWKSFYQTILIAALVFLSWKHGMLRSVYSYGTFLYLVPSVVAFMSFYPIPGLANIKAKNKMTALFLKDYHLFSCLYYIIFLVIFLGFMKNYEHDLNQNRTIINEFYNRYTTLTTYKPKRMLASLVTKIEELKQSNELPLTLKNKIANKTIDEFGSTPELIFLNHLNYSPRPVPIAFIVANQTLNNKNGHYYQEKSSAPEFVLIRDFNLHISDTLAYLSLLVNYHPLNQFKGWFVLEKNSTWQKIELKPILQKQLIINEWFFLDKLQNSFTWVQINEQLTIYGKIKKFLYKPEPVILEILLKNGKKESYVISLSQLDAGFLMNPIIKSKRVENDPNNISIMPFESVKAFRIVIDTSKKQWLYDSKCHVTFSQVMVSKENINLTLDEAKKQIIWMRQPLFPDARAS
jgi:hypothetical protein